MCEAISIGLAAASAGMSALGSMQAGNAANDHARYQSQIAKNNATIAEQEAQDIEARGAIDIARTQRQAATFKSSQRAAAAASGVLVDTGDAALALEDTAALSAYDIAVGRTNIQRAARNARLQKQDFLNQSTLLKAQGRAAQSASRMQGAGDLLSGAGTVADKWYSWKKGQ